MSHFTESEISILKRNGLSEAEISRLNTSQVPFDNAARIDVRRNRDSTAAIDAAIGQSLGAGPGFVAGPGPGGAFELANRPTLPVTVPSQGDLSGFVNVPGSTQFAELGPGFTGQQPLPGALPAPIPQEPITVQPAPVQVPGTPPTGQPGAPQVLDIEGLLGGLQERIDPAELGQVQAAAQAGALLNLSEAFSQPFIPFEGDLVADLTDDQLAAQGLTREAAEQIQALGGQGQQALNELFAGTEAGRKAEAAFGGLAEGGQLDQIIGRLEGQVGASPEVQGALDALKTLRGGGQLDQAGSAALQLLGQQVPGVGQALNTLNTQSQGGVPGLNDIVNQLAGTPGALPGTQTLQGIAAGGQPITGAGALTGAITAGGVTQQGAVAGGALTGLLGQEANIQAAAQAAAAPILRQLQEDILPGIQASAIQQGAFGGSRQQLLQQEAALEAARQAQEVAAGVSLQAQQIGGQQTIDAATQLAAVGQDQFGNLLNAQGQVVTQEQAAEGLQLQAALGLQGGGISQQGLVQEGLIAAGQLGISEADIQQRAAALAGQLGISVQDAQLRVIQQVTGIETAQADIIQGAAAAGGQIGLSQSELDRQALEAAGGLTTQQAGITEAGARGLLGVEAGEQAGITAGLAGLPTVSGVLQQPGQLLQQVGGQIQAQEQAEIGADLARFEEARDFPTEQALQFAGGVSALTGGTGFAPTPSIQGPSTLQRGLGGAATGAGIAGGLATAGIIGTGGLAAPLIIGGSTLAGLLS